MAPSNRPPSNKKQNRNSNTSIPSIATVAMKELDALESKLTLDIVVRPNDKNQIRALARVSPAALRLAADIVNAAPERFPDFTGIDEGAAYVEAMLPLADRARALATHLEKSIRNHRAPASQQALALYAVVKGLGRIVDNEAMREKVLLLKAEVAPKPKNPRPKVTKEQKVLKKAVQKRDERVAKAAKFLVDNGVPVPASSPASPVVTPAAVTTTASVTPNAVAPAASSPRTPSPLAN